ncbi:protein of unknown function [Xenorhabdus nematophila AN6/1]|nr:protein of unknown function [Xenorhabdus nematophila AN6/1]
MNCYDEKNAGRDCACSLLGFPYCFSIPYRYGERQAQERKRQAIRFIDGTNRP